MTRLRRACAPLLVFALTFIAAPAAYACSTDNASYLDTFADAECLILGSMAGTEIDADGGLRLKTGGTPTPTVWDTDAQFDNPPTGDKGTLRVVSAGTAATLELAASELPLTRRPPALSPTGAELIAGPTQVRDNEGVEDPSVIRQGATYVMYYTGYAEDGTPPAIYRATSADGRTFTRPAIVGSDPNPAPVLSAGAPGAWDASGVFGADVVYDPNDATAPYRMYYSGTSAGLRAIGYATSTDGITWIKQVEPVVRPGLPGSRDAFAVAHPSVLKDGQLFKMWYEGDDSTFKAIGYATSVDGVVWKRAGLPASLQQDPLGGGDPKIGLGIFAPTVWKTSTGFKMIFIGRNRNDSSDVRALGATAPDGIDWTIGGPEINLNSQRFYATNLYSPDVLVDPADTQNPYKLYFAGDRALAGDDRSRIGLAESATAAGSFGFFSGSAAFQSIYSVGADNTRFDARNVRGLSVADPGATNDWVGAYSGTRSTRTGASGDSVPKLGIATYDPEASAPIWVKRDGAEPDKSILPLGGTAEDANGQRDPSLLYKQTVTGGTDDWFVYYTALPSNGSNASVRVASADEGSAQNELRPDAWTKLTTVIADASHPSVLRSAGSPFRVYHTVEGVTPARMAVSASSTNDDVDGPFAASTALTFTGASTCDADGAKDPAVIQIGTTLHLLYTGLVGATRNTCYATADTTSSFSAFTRKGAVMPPSEVAYAYDEVRIVPESMFVDTETANAPLNVFFTGTDRGERRFIDANGNTGVFNQHTRVGRATSVLPIMPGLLPSGTATGQLGAANGPLLDFRRIERVKSGSKVEMQMSVLQPYSSPTDISKQYWSDWFPVITGDADTAAQELTFRFGVRAARWRARLTEPTGTPKLDRVTVDSGPLQFDPTGTATTTEIAPPETFVLGSWTDLVLRSQQYTFPFPGATVSDVAGTVTVLGTNDAPVVAATPLTLNATTDQTIPLSGVSPSAHPKLKVKFDMTATGGAPQSTPLVKQLRVNFTAAKVGADTDGDGVPDTADQCPTVAAPGQANGCPAPDSDGDGVPDARDACPTVAAPGQANGCPPDADGDGVPDARDACPTVASAGSPNGCPVALTLAASTTKVTFGRSATLSGTLLRGPLPVPGQMVTVVGLAVGVTAPKPIGTAVTDIAGKWILVVKPSLHTTYTAGIPGVNSVPIRVQVKHLVTLKVAGTGLRKTFTGKIGPRHARRLVIIQRKSGTRWVTFAKVKTGTRSTYKIAKTLTKGKRYQFRARTAGDAQHLLGVSPVRRVRT